MGDGPTPARLPGEAPQQLKDFIACTAASVELDTSAMDWVPKGGLGDAAPAITIEPGAAAGSANVSVGWGFFGIDLPASIGADGELVVDTSSIPDIPDLTSGLKDGIDNWVSAFNATMAANGKRLDGFTVDGTKVTITKRPVVAAPPAAPAVVAAPPAGPGTGAVEPPNGPEPEPEKSTNWGCLTWALGALAVLGIGAVVVIATTGDDAEAPSAATTVTPTDVSTSEPSVPPTDDPVPGTAPVAPVATDAPLATDARVATDAPVATDVPVATDAPTDGATEPDDVGLSAPDPFANALDQAFVGLVERGTPTFVQPLGRGDVFDCADQSPVDNPGPDITGVVGVDDGPFIAVVVLMNQSPLLTAEDFSFAVALQSFTASNQRRTFQWEVHDGVQAIGERDAAGHLDPASGIVTIDDRAVRFSVPNDPSDPLAGIFVQGFNTPAASDSVSCDQAIVVPIDFPLPPTEVAGDCTPDATTACVNNGRFAVTLVGPDGPATTTNSDVGDAAGFESGDVSAWARVVDACPLSDTFWVFAAATTDVEYELTVVDTADDPPRTYVNPLGPDLRAITDTSAFATCP